MAKIAVIGICGNSQFMTVDHFHENGETLVADSVFCEIGGKGINQAVAAARMGAEVSFLAAIGDDAAGEDCRRAAAADGIDGHFAVTKGVPTTFAVILTDKKGENRVTEYKGAQLTAADVAGFEEAIAASDFLLIQHEVPAEVNLAAVRLAVKHGTRVILNPAPIRDVSDEMAAAVYAVTPNEQEKQAIAIERFRHCVTTLGSHGCQIDGDVFVPALPVTAVDTTGAGDTFNGVLAVMLAEGASLEEAARYAVAASGISVTRRYVLAAIPFRNEIEKEIGK